MKIVARIVVIVIALGLIAIMLEYAFRAEDVRLEQQDNNWKQQGYPITNRGE